MQTMPRITLKFMRFVIERLLTRIATWEDQHGNELDYRMKYLNSGLHQASQSLREIIDGEFNPMRKNEQIGTVGKPWSNLETRVLDEDSAYVAELFRDNPVPLRTVN
jgi:hypothetical protein